MAASLSLCPLCHLFPHPPFLHHLLPPSMTRSSYSTRCFCPWLPMAHGRKIQTPYVADRPLPTSANSRPPTLLLIPGAHLAGPQACKSQPLPQGLCACYFLCLEYYPRRARAAAPLPNPVSPSALPAVQSSHPSFQSLSLIFFIVPSTSLSRACSPLSPLLEGGGQGARLLLCPHGPAQGRAQRKCTGNVC